MASQQTKDAGDDPLSFLKDESMNVPVSARLRKEHDNTLAYGALALAFFASWLPFVGLLCVVASIVLLVMQHTSESKLSTGGIVAAVLAWFMNALRLAMVFLLLLR